MTTEMTPNEVTKFGWDLTDMIHNSSDDEDLFTSAERTTDGSYEMTVTKNGRTFRVRITEE
jgi:hypothetical protein